MSLCACGTKKIPRINDLRHHQTLSLFHLVLVFILAAPADVGSRRQKWAEAHKTAHKRFLPMPSYPRSRGNAIAACRADLRGALQQLTAAPAIGCCWRSPHMCDNTHDDLYDSAQTFGYVNTGSERTGVRCAFASRIRYRSAPCSAHDFY